MFILGVGKAREILSEHKDVEDFVRRRLLKGWGAFYKEWTNEKMLRLMWRRAEEIANKFGN